MRNVKIQSFSDIITNSSSEVYMCLSYNGVEIFKEIINSILKVSGSDKEWDEYFEIEEYGESIKVKAIDSNNEDIAYILNRVNDIFYVTD